LIHCAGICDVEKCEADPKWAELINVKSIRYILRYLPKKTRLVYCSSDHVFSGDSGPYTEYSTPDPISKYGKTRVDAERLIQKYRKDSLIIRYGLGIGPSIGGRTGHLNWLQYRHENGLPLTVIADEYRSAVWTHDLVKRVMELAYSNHIGIRHIPSDRTVSRLQLARYLNETHQIGASLDVRLRSQIKGPHLGRVELKSQFRDALS